MGSLALIAALPLLGFLVNGLFGSRLPRRVVALIGCALPALAFAITVSLFMRLASGAPPITETLYSWVLLSSFKVDVALHFDAMTAVMCLVVTGIGTLIHVYSVGYMAHDKSFARYFAYLNLFLFFMLLLVLGNNLLVLFVGWEGVGLASYLLIGFWFEDPEKTAAGVKAFIVNRVGDTGFVVAAFLIYVYAGSFDFQVINAYFSTPGAVARRDHDHRPAAAARRVRQVGADPAACLAAGRDGRADAGVRADSCGHHGHRRRVPPRAPERALRCTRPTAMTVVAWIGAATALLGATMGVTQFNLKKVLAYSTISQIGFMVMACGVGAFSVGLFHLMTHAFFKACLFLGAGAVLHALQGEEDMRNMGALARRLPFTFATFLAGTLALCGIPPFAGFFSKDEILWQAWSAAGGSPWLWLVGLAASGLTAFYMFRAIYLTFFGTSRVPERPSGRRARATAFDVDRARRARRRLARRRVHRNARRPARVPRRLGAVLQLSRAAVPRGGCRASRCEHRDRADGDRAARGGRGHLPGVALLRSRRPR